MVQFSLMVKKHRNQARHLLYVDIIIVLIVSNLCKRRCVLTRCPGWTRMVILFRAVG